MKKELTFSLIGGTLQPRISSFADFPAILELDDARWALTSISRYALRADGRLLDYLDADGNGRIRCDEVRTALRFMLDHFSSGKGVDAASPRLDFADLAAGHPDTEKILAAAKKILDRKGIAADSISLDDLNDERELRENASFGDGGKLLAGDGGTPEAEKLLELICRCLGCESVGIEEIDRFVSGAAEVLAWRNCAVTDKAALFPFGDETVFLAGETKKLEKCVDDYFLQCETLTFLSGAKGRPARQELNADPLDADEIAQLLPKLTLAEPRADGMLDLAAPLHPLYRAALQNLFACHATQKYLKNGILSRDAWEKFKAELAPFFRWQEEKPEYSGFFDAFSTDEVAAFSGRSGFSPLEEAIRQTTRESDGIRLLCKLLLFQRDMLKFLRNYVSLADLFDIRTASMLRRGELVLDARHFTLITPVENLSAHKKITEGSNICIAYIEVHYGVTEKVPVRTMAVGITSGDMKRLFVGKHGVFYDPSGEVLDAVIVDFVEQPVSFWEALKSPFVSFGRMITEQTGKLFSTAQTQKQQQIINVGGMPAASPASGGLPMLFMGGGIGIAALGGAVAFIAGALRSVSFLHILGAVIAIFLIFSGPPTIHSLIKLFHRDLGRFLEASGCAVNFPMRLSCRLGYFFTRKPNPCSIKLLPSETAVKRGLIAGLVLLALALGIAGSCVSRYVRNRTTASAETVSSETISAETVSVETEKTVSPENPPPLPCATEEKP